MRLQSLNLRPKVKETENGIFKRQMVLFSTSLTEIKSLDMVGKKEIGVIVWKYPYSLS